MNHDNQSKREGLLEHQSPPEDGYYQHTEAPSTNNNNNYTWSITDFGNIPERSLDGSIHATDEVFNAASHLAATLLSILGSALLIAHASTTQEIILPNNNTTTSIPPNPWKIVSFSIYGASLILLFGCSTLHHAVLGPSQNFWRRMDYAAIYPLIAGTLTPLCLVFYHNNATGWVFFATVWGIAVVGVTVTAVWFPHIPKWASMTVYLTTGWMGACMTYWIIPAVGYGGFGLFLMGGIFYTVGGYVYTTEQPNPVPGRFGFHEIWHVMVILGAATHYMLMFFFVLPV